MADLADLSALAEPRLLKAVVPDEPPSGSVVLDNGKQYSAGGRPFRVAWQRIGDIWMRTGSVAELRSLTGSSLEWSQLITRHGPLTLIHCEEGP